MQTIDQIATAISSSNATISLESVKNVIIRLAIQTYRKGENVQESLDGILEQVLLNGNDRIANSISNLASKFS